LIPQEHGGLTAEVIAKRHNETMQSFKPNNCSCKSNFYDLQGVLFRNMSSNTVV
jgi:hypothetical protein